MQGFCELYKEIHLWKETDGHKADWRNKQKKKLEKNLYTNLSWGHHKAFVLKVLKISCWPGGIQEEFTVPKERNHSVLPGKTSTFTEQRTALGPNTILPKDTSSLQVVFLVGQMQRVVEITGVQINVVLKRQIQHLNSVLHQTLESNRKCLDSQLLSKGKHSANILDPKTVLLLSSLCIKTKAVSFVSNP